MSDTNEEEETEKKPTRFEAFTYILLAATTVCLFIVYEGWVLGTLWNWFIPAILPLSKINTIQGIALILVSDLLCKDTVIDLTEFGPKFKVAYIKKSFFKVSFALVAGWALKYMMGVL